MSHIVTCKSATSEAVKVMAVNAIENNRLAVDQEIMTFYFDAAETNFLAGDLNDVSGRVDQLERKCV